VNRELSVMVGMDYPGKEISKNYLWRNGNRRHGMNPTAKKWKRVLADSVTSALLAQFGTAAHNIKPPVTVRISGSFTDRNHAVDLHNLGELVCDAVQEGTGIDDKHFKLETGTVTYRVRVPEIVVTVTVSTDG
jgi:hypothetical protein